MRPVHSSLAPETLVACAPGVPVEMPPPAEARRLRALARQYVVMRRVRAAVDIVRYRAGNASPLDVIAVQVDAVGSDLLPALTKLHSEALRARIIVCCRRRRRAAADPRVGEAAWAVVSSPAEAVVVGVHAAESGNHGIARIVGDRLRTFRVAPRMRQVASKPRLTRREPVVLRLIARGKTNRLIGEELFITDQTVKTHVRHTYASWTPPTVHTPWQWASG